MLAAYGAAVRASRFHSLITIVAHDRRRLPWRRGRARALGGQQQQAVGRRGERGVVGLLRHARAVGQEALAEQRVADIGTLALLAACARAAAQPAAELTGARGDLGACVCARALPAPIALCRLLGWQGRRALQRARRFGVRQCGCRPVLGKISMDRPSRSLLVTVERPPYIRTFCAARRYMGALCAS